MGFLTVLSYADYPDPYRQRMESTYTLQVLMLVRTVAQVFTTQGILYILDLTIPL